MNTYNAPPLSVSDAGVFTSTYSTGMLLNVTGYVTWSTAEVNSGSYCAVWILTDIGSNQVHGYTQVPLLPTGDGVENSAVVNFSGTFVIDNGQTFQIMADHNNTVATSIFSGTNTAAPNGRLSITRLL